MKYWYDWNTIPWTVRCFLKEGNLLTNDRYVNVLLDATLKGFINYPDFFPKYRRPFMCDIPNFVGPNEALNEKAKIWKWQINVNNGFEKLYDKSFVKRFLWCAENSEEEWHADFHTTCIFLFKSSHDAMTFKMLWR